MSNGTISTPARALCLDFSHELIDLNIERTQPMGPNRTSSVIDFVEGSEVEVGPIWREPLRRAMAVGIPMPHLERLLNPTPPRLGKSQDFLWAMRQEFGKEKERTV